MNSFNGMRRSNAAGWMNVAAHNRQCAVKVGFAPELKASFLSDCRKFLEWAKTDRRYAEEDGFKLP